MPGLTYKSLYLFGIMLTMLYQLEAQSNDLLNKIAAQYQSDYRVPGLAIAVVRTDTIFLGCSGTKQIRQDMPVDQQALFHIGSNTKAFTAFLAAHLVERGVLNWSDKLMEVVPELNRPDFAAYQDITLAQLLTHQAGIAPFESGASKEFRALPKHLEEYPDPRLAFAEVALSFPPQVEQGNHKYSNGGYILAALMLERATSSTFEKLLEELAQQLNLKLHFGFPQAGVDTTVLGHRRSFLGLGYRSLRPNNRHAMPPYFAPAGDISINLQDLAAWVQLHLRGLSGEAKYLKPETFQQLHYGWPYYSLGWYNGKVGEGSDRFSYHGGSLGTFSSAIMLSAERNTGIIILVNAESKQVTRLKEQLRVELWEKFGKPRQR